MIVKMLEISTAHLSEGARAAMTAGMSIGVTYEPWNEFGWIIAIYPEEALIECMYDEIKEIITYCNEQGITFIKFDCDAEFDHNFKSF